MRYTMTTRRDLRNWVDSATTNWDVRSDADVDAMTDWIQRDDHPAWGSDWTAYLEELDLVRIITGLGR
jgi:hypothetical protein